MGRKMKEDEADKAVTSKVLENAGARLLGHVKLIEDAIDQAGAARQLIKDRIEVAKGEGYNPKAIRALIKERALSVDAKAARAAVLEEMQLYLEACGVAENG